MRSEQFERIALEHLTALWCHVVYVLTIISGELTSEACHRITITDGVYLDCCVLVFFFGEHGARSLDERGFSNATRCSHDLEVSVAYRTVLFHRTPTRIFEIQHDR